MKKNSLLGAPNSWVALCLFLVLLGCESDDVHFHKKNNLTLKVIHSKPWSINPNGRSNPSTKLITGMDWLPNQPSFIEMSHPTLGGGAGYSFGNTIPASSRTACTVVGDFNGDGINEFIIGYNSSSGPFLIKTTGPDLLSGISMFYSGSTFWTLVGVAAVDFDGNGVDELIVAFNSSQGPALYKGNTTSIGTKIYQGPTSRSVVAVAGGDFLGNGNEELIVAYNSSSGPSLYRSQGSNGGSLFYQGSTFWTIAAVTAADFDNNNSDELITGFNSSLGPALYKSNATSIGSKIYQGATSIGTLRALTSGKFGTNCLMHVGFYSPSTGTAIYGHNGNNLLSVVVSWSSPEFAVKSLASGTFDFPWE